MILVVLSIGVLTAACDAATAPGNGVYRVGEEIQPGKWRSTGASDDCYWARYDAGHNLLGSHFGVAGGTVAIRATDYEVEFSGCGQWEYVENEVKALRPEAMDPKGDGVYTVGVEIAPGQWRRTGAGGDCHWVRLDALQKVLATGSGEAGGAVTLKPADYEVEFSGCGTWEYAGP